MGDTTARIAVIGAEGAAHLLVTRFPDPTTPEVQQIKADFTARYNANTATPWIAAERGYIDAVIEPHDRVCGAVAADGLHRRPAAAWCLELGLDQRRSRHCRP